MKPTSGLTPRGLRRMRGDRGAARIEEPELAESGLTKKGLRRTVEDVTGKKPKRSTS